MLQALRPMHRFVTCVLVLLFARTAGAHPRRKLHAGLTIVGGTIYVVSEAFVKEQLAPDTCRWCNPPSLDTAIRDVAKWHDVETANTASNFSGFILAPVMTVG